MKNPQEALAEQLSFIHEHLFVICTELRDWSKTGILIDGRVREAAHILNGTGIPHVSAMSIVKSLVGDILIEEYTNRNFAG